MDNKQISSPNIEVLNLDVKSFNALKRAEVNTIADIENRMEELESTIPPKHWKNITDALNNYNGIPTRGSWVEENMLGEELTFDDIADMVGEIIIKDFSTESRAYYKAVKVEKIITQEDGSRSLMYYDGAKHLGRVNERYFDKNLSRPDRAWRVKLQDKPAELPTVQPERAEEVAERFNYAVLTAELGDYLRHKEEQLRNEYMNFTANCGRIFAEAQEKLAKHGFGENNGVFDKWISSMGFAKPSVYRMISVYNFRSSQIETNEQAQLFDSLSKSLQYEIAKPSAPPELVEQVMNGDITTHKEYIKLKKELEEAEEHNAVLSAEKEQFHNASKANLEKLNEERERSTKLEQRIKELENKPVDVAVDVDELNRRVSAAVSRINSETEHTLAVERREFADTLNAKDDRIWELEDEVKKLKSSPTYTRNEKILAFQMSMDQYKKLLEIVNGSNDKELYKAVQSVKFFN